MDTMPYNYIIDTKTSPHIILDGIYRDLAVGGIRPKFNLESLRLMPDAPNEHPADVLIVRAGNRRVAFSPISPRWL